MAPERDLCARLPDSMVQWSSWQPAVSHGEKRIWTMEIKHHESGMSFFFFFEFIYQHLIIHWLISTNSGNKMEEVTTKGNAKTRVVERGGDTVLLAGLHGADVCRADREDPLSVATRNRGKRLTLHAVGVGTRDTCISLLSSL